MQSSNLVFFNPPTFLFHILQVKSWHCSSIQTVTSSHTCDRLYKRELNIGWTWHCPYIFVLKDRILFSEDVQFCWTFFPFLYMSDLGRLLDISSFPKPNIVQVFALELWWFNAWLSLGASKFPISHIVYICTVCVFCKRDVVCDIYVTEFYEVFAFLLWKAFWTAFKSTGNIWSWSLNLRLKNRTKIFGGLVYVQGYEVIRKKSIIYSL